MLNLQIIIPNIDFHCKGPLRHDHIYVYFYRSSINSAITIISKLIQELCDYLKGHNSVILDKPLS